MGTEDTIEMVIIKNDTIIKKKFSVIDEDEVISFNLGNFLIAVKKEDLRKLMWGGTKDAIHKRRYWKNVNRT